MLAHIIRIGLSIIFAILLRKVSSKKIKVSLLFIIISIFLASLAYGLIGMLVIFVPALLFVLLIKYSLNKTWHKKAYILTYILFSLYIVLQAADLFIKVLITQSTQEVIFKFAVVLLGVFILVLNYEISKLSENQDGAK
jgi:hypothetical protein